MSILVDQNTISLIQGITGHEGSRAASEMLHYKTAVVAGVTPGKGGQKTKHGIPVYNSIKEALHYHPTVNTSLVAVPAQFAADAAMEAIWNDIPLVNILTEKIPVADVAKVIALGKERNVRVVGPSSVGIISPAKAKIGAIGASELVDRVFKKGAIGIISKSGGMTAELSRIITAAGLGQSTAIGIGGDVLLGTTFVDCAHLFEKDSQTKAIVVFGEVGGTYEEELADAILKKEITKPIVALIAGDFSRSLPQGTVLGHAGAIVSKGKGSAKSKINALKKAGVQIATTPEDIPVLLKKVL
ncbi:MAG: succinate--CoA ligase subunit alpha [Candidatus Andersenbacteria bacterium]